MVCAPCFIFVLHDDLPQTSWKPVLVVVYDRLSDMQGCLAYHVFELLPAAVGWDLLFQNRTNSSSEARARARPLSREGMMIVEFGHVTDLE